MAERPQYRPKGVPAPDKAPRGKTQPASKPTGRLPADRPFKLTPAKIRDSLESTLGLAILALQAKGMAGDEVALADAQTLVETGPDLIDSWMWLAERNTSVRRALEWLCGGGGYLTFTLANLAVVLSLAQNHGYYPAEWPTPSSLKTVMGNMFTTSENGTQDGGASGDPATASTSN